MGKVCSNMCKPKYQGLENEISENPKIKLSKHDFVRIQDLGKGGYGKVVAVKRKTQQDDPQAKKYAMKIIDKDKIFKNKLQISQLLEKNVLQNNKNAFIVNLKCSFQDTRNVFIVMEYVAGGDLYSHIPTNKGFPQDTAKFIFLQVLLGIQHLHEKMMIAYRDLKPENVLVTEDGFCKLADFGLSKSFENQQLMFDFVGTPEYLAPEILIKPFRGYTKSVDVWQLGIFLYELISGGTPFQDPTKPRNQRVIFDKIQHHNVGFDKRFTAEAKDLISQLLQKNPQQRIGKKGGFQEVKSHMYFTTGKEYIEQKLADRMYDSPLKPYMKIKKRRDLRPMPVVDERNYSQEYEKIQGFTFNEAFGAGTPETKFR